MNKFTRIFAAVAFLAIASIGQAQIILTPTTLSAAAAVGQKNIVVASATPNASTLDNFAVGTGVIIGNSYGVVQAVSGTTITVNWGSSSGSTVVAHPNAAQVWSARTQFLGTKPNVPTGACTRSAQQVLPFVNVNNALGAGQGTITDCIGGRWITGEKRVYPPFRVESNPSGGTAYTSLNTNGTAVGATTLYCTSVFLPVNKLLTGIAVLNGTTVTANKRYVILYDSTGVPLANSALAGAASVTASIYEGFAFVNTASTPVAGKFMAVGPAQYFACLQDDAVGSTTVRMAVTGTGDNILTKGQTGATFGTVPTLTVPTTFTTAVGPYVYLY